VSEMWEQHKPFSVALIVWLGGGLLFLLAVRLPLSGPVAALRGADVEGAAGLPSKDDLKKHYAPADGMSVGAAPFADAEAAVKKQGARLDAELNTAVQQIEFRPGPGFVVALNVKQRAYEFTRIRDAIAPKLREMANKANVRIPNEIDPRQNAKELPREREADELLFRLAMTDRIIRCAVAAGVGHLAGVRHDLGAMRGAPFAERRVEVKLVCGLDEIIAFIGKCSLPLDEGAPEDAVKQSGGVLILRAAAIEREGERGSILAARLTLAAVSATKLEQPQPKQAKTVKGRKARRSF
jgi:hypothetical protein